MSNALAIASVTAVLKDLLNNGVIDHDLTSAVGGDVTVTALPPDRINTEPPNAQSQLNLFLYQVTPNQGWRNVGLPSRDSQGQRISNPPLPLNLHFLLTAYGADEFHAEILLGYAMQIFHTNQVLPREAIRTALAPQTPFGTGLLPPPLRALSASELADQVELIKITPEGMSTEEISKLWTAFQAKYRPTVAYEASVVLIEEQRSIKSPLPVRSRSLYVRTFRQPSIDEIRSQVNDGAPIRINQPILPGHRLVIVGSQLQSEDTAVKIGGIEVAPAAENVTNSRIIVSIPPQLSAGVHGVQVIHRIPMGVPPDPRRAVESNVCAFVLRPQIIALAVGPNVTTANDGTLSAEIHVTLNPAVEVSQRITLLLNELLLLASPPVSEDSPASYSFVALSNLGASPPYPSNLIIVPVIGVRAGTYLARVQVDGAESLLGTNAQGQYNSPQFTIS